MYVVRTKSVQKLDHSPEPPGLEVCFSWALRNNFWETMTTPGTSPSIAVSLMDRIERPPFHLQNVHPFK